MRNFLAQADSVLRPHFGMDQPGSAAHEFSRLLSYITVGGIIYGAVMGTFGGLSADRAWQVVFSAVKVPLLLLATFLITLPSFFVFNTLLGVRADFREALRALVATQAGLAIILAGLAPYTALWYVSSTRYHAAVFFNGAIFALASFTAHWLLRRYYSLLIARNAKHRRLLRVWMVSYVFVAIQMAWVLRPFVGDPSRPPTLIRQEVWGNAYVVVARLIWDTLFR